MKHSKVILGIAVVTTIGLSGCASEEADKPEVSASSVSASSSPEHTPPPSPSPSPSKDADKPERPRGYVNPANITPWPLTVGSGILACDNGAVTIKAGGKVYGVNGTATGRDGHPEIDPIWADDEKTLKELEDAGVDPDDITPPKIPIGELIDHGLKLCD